MSNEVAVKEQTQVAEATIPNFFREGEIDASDIKFPSVLLQQGLSDYVAKGEARMGDMVNSLTGEKLGDAKTPVWFIPLIGFKSYLEFTLENGVQKFLSNTVWTPETRNLPQQFTTEDGRNAIRYLAYNYYVLLGKNSDEWEPFPHLLMFKSTSGGAGRKLNAQITMCSANNVAPYQRAFGLACNLKENEKGKFYVFDIAGKRKATDEEVAAAKMWIPRLRPDLSQADTKDGLKEETDSDIGF